MATHEELASIPDGDKRLCVDRVVRDDSDGRVDYAFVWRGTKASPDGFIPRPPYFSWSGLGELLRAAALAGALSRMQLGEMLQGLIGVAEDADGTRLE